MRPALEVRDLTMEYASADYLIRPLDGLTFDASDGELVVVLGPSGCGKTTLLSCLAGLLTPTSGYIRYGDTEVTALRGKAMADYRRRTVGVVFQAFNLIPSLTALRNVMAPLELAGVSRRPARAKAEELLNVVGLEDRMANRPSKLSGGQQQRVAIARSLVHDPPLVIADEPTAHLDYVQVEGILRLVRELAAPGRVVLIATHDDRLTKIADRVIHLVPEAQPVSREPVRVNLPAGQLLFAQGDASDLVYVVEEGEIEIFRVSPDHRDRHVTTIRAGGYFGELGPLLGMPRNASARAVGPAVLIGYPPDLFTERAKLGTPSTPDGKRSRSWPRLSVRIRR